MIKLLIADDEAYIRQGISCCIDWERNGITVVGEAADGEDAFHKAGTLLPDIVLTDIQMPIMNGLELVEKFRSAFPGLKIVVLTAYGNEDNFIRAIEAGVDGFVLKSADSERILQTVLAVKEKLLQERVQVAEVNRIRALYSENQHLLLATLFSRFLKNNLPMGAFLRRVEKLQIALRGPRYALLLAHTPKTDDPLTIAVFSRNLAPYNPFVFYCEDNQLVAVLNTEAAALTQKVMATMLGSLDGYVVGNALAVFPEIEKLEQLPWAYAYGKQSLEYCFWNQEEPYIWVDRRQFFPHLKEEELFRMEGRVYKALHQEEEIRVLDQLEKLYLYWQTNLLPREALMQSAVRVLWAAHWSKANEPEGENYMAMVQQLQNPEDVLLFLTEALALEIKEPVKNDSSDRVLAYIHAHYSQEISLRDIAASSYLSVSYVSRIIRAKTGVSLTEYIHRLRIEKAKTLLCQSERKHYEIAEEVGYSNYKYFAAYFNKFVGMSASDYRAFRRGQGENRM